MKIKSIILSFIGVFIALWATDFLIHQVFLCKSYAATADLWRPHAEMKNFFSWMILGWAIIALGYAILVTLSAKSIYCGLGIGGCIGLVHAGGSFAFYSVMPLPLSLCVIWAIAGIIQGMIVGFVGSLIAVKVGNCGCCGGGSCDTKEEGAASDQA